MRLLFAPLAVIAGAVCIAGCSTTTPSPPVPNESRLMDLRNAALAVGSTVLAPLAGLWVAA